jgi:hypothetical protein
MHHPRTFAIIYSINQNSKKVEKVPTLTGSLNRGIMYSVISWACECRIHVIKRFYCLFPQPQFLVSKRNWVHLSHTKTVGKRIRQNLAVFPRDKSGCVLYFGCLQVERGDVDRI